MAFRHPYVVVHDNSIHLKLYLNGTNALLVEEISKKRPELYLSRTKTRADTIILLTLILYPGPNIIGKIR